MGDGSILVFICADIVDQEGGHLDTCFKAFKNLIDVGNALKLSQGTLDETFPL